MRVYRLAGRLTSLTGEAPNGIRNSGEEVRGKVRRIKKFKLNKHREGPFV